MASATLILSVLTGCAGVDQTASVDDRPVVVASIFPVGDLVQSLTGEGVRVEILLPPGVSPAMFDVTPRQLQDLQNASLFYMIGGGLDEWVASLTEGHGTDIQVIRLSEGIPLLEGGGHGHGDEGEGNPHVWLDPILVRDHLLPRMVETLEQAYPELSAQISQRAGSLADSLTALDQEIREALEGLDHRAFLSTHAAWSYFALRYGLDEAGVIHSHPGEDPSSREMAQLMEEAREHQINCLFIEPQLGEVAARALATELSLPTCMLDPLGGEGVEDRDGYFELLRFNTRQFLKGLERDAG
jgi:zinc transport system substrate-binding protein